MQATVILHVDPADVLAALPPMGDARRAMNGEVVRVRALEDCVAIDLDRSLTEEPMALLARIVELVGPVLVAQHADPPGIPAYPSSHALTATRWDAIAEELGEAAEWIPLTAPGSFAMPDLGAMFGAEGAALAAQLQGPQGAQLMESAMAMAQQLMASGDLDALMGGGGLDLEALKGRAEAMLQRDPELERKLREQFAAMMPDETSDDTEDGDE